MNKQITILGAGPTGLGAAHRLQELGYRNWQIFEADDHVGGLASSYTDQKGFIWDVGGHVQFSHYKYFDALMDELLGKRGWFNHQRESWVWILNRFVPYPFQNNIRLLPPDVAWECLSGIIDANINPNKISPKNFQEWIYSRFGAGIAKYFMLPYNYKVWAYPPQDMSYQWVGERVAVTDLRRVAKNMILGQNDVSWGPNNTFRFPKRGGTGAIWKALGERLPDKQVHINHRVTRIDTQRKLLRFSTGRQVKYDLLISTIPLREMIIRSRLNRFTTAAKKMKYSTVHVIGLGLHGQKPPDLKSKCWMYFPETNAPFYRATVFSNYSPANVPNHKKQWSLMLEVSESSKKHEIRDTMMQRVIEGCLQTKLIKRKTDIISRWHFTTKYGYPTPFLDRDAIVDPVLKNLERLQIYSRGRFGAWKYEVSNQDHSLMQGVEIVNRLLLRKTEMTVWHPEIVNAKKI